MNIGDINRILILLNEAMVCIARNFEESDNFGFGLQVNQGIFWSDMHHRETYPRADT
jgi:hypothetical protein